jgi:ankyrin repeat protein
VAVVDALVAHGADPFLRDAHSRTCLHVAARHGHADVIAALLRPGRVFFYKSGRKTLPSPLADTPFKWDANVTRYIDSRGEPFK